MPFGHELIQDPARHMELVPFTTLPVNVPLEVKFPDFVCAVPPVLIGAYTVPLGGPEDGSENAKATAAVPPSTAREQTSAYLPIPNKAFLYICGIIG